jgi:hypothetical protein
MLSCLLGKIDRLADFFKDYFAGDEIFSPGAGLNK